MKYQTWVIMSMAVSSVAYGATNPPVAPIGVPEPMVDCVNNCKNDAAMNQSMCDFILESGGGITAYNNCNTKSDAQFAECMDTCKVLIPAPPILTMPIPINQSPIVTMAPPLMPTNLR